MVHGDFANHTNDPELVSYIRSFIPFIQAQKSLAFNGQTDSYHLQKGGVVNLDYMADDYYGNATISDINNGWHIKATVDNLTDALVQHYGSGFMQKSTIAWMKDNMRATYNVKLDLIFDKTAKKFIKATTSTTLKNATIVYQKGLPPLKITDALVHMENKITTFTADRGTISHKGKNLGINNLKVVRDTDILTSNFKLTGDMSAITPLAFNTTTKLKNPYAFAHITQGIFKGTLQATIDLKHKKILAYNINGTIAKLHADYKTLIGNTNLNGTAVLGGIKISISPVEKNLRINTLQGTINNTAQGITGPMALKNITIAEKSGAVTMSIQSVTSEVQSNDIKFTGPVTADSLKFSISPVKKTLSINTLQGTIRHTAQGIAGPIALKNITVAEKSDTTTLNIQSVTGEVQSKDIKFTGPVTADSLKFSMSPVKKTLSINTLQGTINHTAQGITGPMTLKNITVFEKSGAITISIQSVTSQVQSNDIKFTGPVTADSLKFFISPVEKTLSINTLHSTIDHTAQGIAGPMALKNITVAKKSDTTTLNIQSVTGEIQGKDTQFKGPITIHTLKLSLKPKHTTAQIKFLQGTSYKNPVKMEDIALDIKGDVLGFGGHITGDVSQIIGDKLPNDIHLKQGYFKGKTKITYHIKQKKLQSYAIQGTLKQGTVNVPILFQGIKTPYVIHTDSMAINVSTTTTELQGHIAVDNTATGTIHIVKKDQIMQLDFKGGST